MTEIVGRSSRVAKTKTKFYKTTPTGQDNDFHANWREAGMAKS